jgi:hypothetical protein
VVVPVSLLYLAGACLVVAQVVGIYGLVTRKADFIFALLMAVLLVIAVVIGGLATYHKLH